ncbi:MAG: thiamine diphosphokinase [Eggerthellaceae bacterium]
MRAALVGAVQFNGGHFLKQRFDCVIAVDGGYASLRRIGVMPDIAVGDFDSLGFVPDCPTRTFPVEKDASDMELALHEALGRGCDEVLLYGAFAARLDHTIANLELLMALAKRGVRAFGIGDTFAVTALYGSASTIATDHLRFSGNRLLASGLAVEGHAADACHSESDLPLPVKEDAGADYGNFLSVFALNGDAHGVCERGLKYCIEDATMPGMSSLGLSNEFTDEDVDISVRQGSLVITFPINAYQAIV